MTKETQMELTNQERKTFLRLYSGLVELQASALYYVSEGLDNADKVRRASKLVGEFLEFRKEVLGDVCPAGTIPCGDGDCRPPGGCGPIALLKLSPKGD